MKLGQRDLKILSKVSFMRQFLKCKKVRKSQCSIGFVSLGLCRLKTFAKDSFTHLVLKWKKEEKAKTS